MNYLLHGDNLILSRQKLTSLIDEARANGIKEVIRLDGKKLSETQLRQALETKSLFGTDRLIIVERLFSRPRSKALDILVNHLINPTHTVSIILWEAKELTAARIRSLKNFQPFLFKTPRALYQFLDNLRPGNGKRLLLLRHQALKKEAVELIFYMLGRRVSELVIAQDKRANELLAGAPWQKGKLLSQAKLFTQSALLILHEKLLEIDEGQKTGTSLLTLDTELDLLLTKI